MSGSVWFYKGIVGEETQGILGTLESLMTFVDEQALTQWDRFLELNDASSPSYGLRFVQAGGVWRAFNEAYGDFIAEWDGTTWSTKRTAARKAATVNIPGVGPVQTHIPTSGDLSSLKNKAKERQKIKRVEDPDEVSGIAAWIPVSDDSPLQFEDDPEGGVTIVGVDPAFDKVTVVAVDRNAGYVTGPVDDDVGDVRSRMQRAGLCPTCGSNDGMLCVCWSR